MELQIIRPGLVGYKEAYDLQTSLLARRQQKEIPDTLILLQHPPVITIGKRGKETDVLINPAVLQERGIELHETDRGGEVTYHGPGQIVGYLIFDVTNHEKDLHLFVSRLEQVFINLLQETYGIQAGRDSEHTGVRVGNEKITAIGIAVRRWVSMHGFAFNTETNLDYFSLIVPCGIRDKGVTSLHKLTSAPILLHRVEEQIIEQIVRIYGFTNWREVKRH
jgi:lipoyl(octanoyl) transferase